MPNFNIISFYDISLRKKSLTCILLLSLLFPPPPPHFFLSSSLSPPTPTQDNHPKAKFSIKSVTLFHSHRVIHGIMHTNHSNTKLFLNSPVRKINPQAQAHICAFRMCTINTSAQRCKPCNAHIVVKTIRCTHACICRHIIRKSFALWTPIIKVRFYFIYFLNCSIAIHAQSDKSRTGSKSNSPNQSAQVNTYCVILNWNKFNYWILQSVNARVQFPLVCLFLKKSFPPPLTFTVSIFVVHIHISKQYLFTVRLSKSSKSRQ